MALTFEPAPFLVIELKWYPEDDPTLLAEKVLTIVQERGFLDQSIFVGFDWRGLAYIRQLRAAAQLWCTTDKPVAANPHLMQLIAGIGANGWFPHYSNVTAEAMHMARERDLKVATWTVNDYEEMQTLIALGLEAICTDYPNVLFKAAS